MLSSVEHHDSIIPAGAYQEHLMLTHSSFSFPLTVPLDRVIGSSVGITFLGEMEIN